MNEIIEAETYWSQLTCRECDALIDSTHCDGCDEVLFEMADYHEGSPVFHVSTMEGELHFCSKECAEKFLKEHPQKKAEGKV